MLFKKYTVARFLGCLVFQSLKVFFARPWRQRLQVLLMRRGLVMMMMMMMMYLGYIPQREGFTVRRMSLNQDTFVSFLLMLSL